jgi:hypothetical protein
LGNVEILPVKSTISVILFRGQSCIHIEMVVDVLVICTKRMYGAGFGMCLPIVQ